MMMESCSRFFALSRSTLGLSKVFSTKCQHNLCCKVSDNDSVSKPVDEVKKPNSETAKASQSTAKSVQSFMMLKARRRALSPMERVGNLISENFDESKTEPVNVNHKDIQTGVINGKIVLGTECEANSVADRQNIVEAKPKRSVIPSKRLRHLIPDEYWKTENEDTKNFVENLDSNIDTKDEHQD